MVGFLRRIATGDKKSVGKDSNKQLSRPSSPGPQKSSDVPPSLPSLPSLPPLYARFATTAPQTDATVNGSNSPLISLEQLPTTTWDLEPELLSSRIEESPSTDVWDATGLYSVTASPDLMQSLPNPLQTSGTLFSSAFSSSPLFARQEEKPLPSNPIAKPIKPSDGFSPGVLNYSTTFSAPGSTPAQTTVITVPLRQVRGDQSIILPAPSKMQSPLKREDSVSSSDSSFSVSNYYTSPQPAQTPKVAPTITPGFRGSTFSTSPPRHENQVQPIRHPQTSRSPVVSADSRPPPPSRTTTSPRGPVHVGSTASFVSSRNYASDSTEASRRTMVSTAYTSGSSTAPVKKQSDVINAANHGPIPSARRRASPNPPSSTSITRPAMNTSVFGNVPRDTYDSQRPSRSASSTNLKQPSTPVNKANLTPRQSSSFKYNSPSRYPSPPSSNERSNRALRQPPVVDRVSKESASVDVLGQSEVHLNPDNKAVTYSKTAPVRKGPLIFAAMTTVHQAAETIIVNPSPTPYVPEGDVRQRAYPSPPADPIPLADFNSQMQRNASASSKATRVSSKGTEDSRRHVSSASSYTHHSDEVARQSSGHSPIESLIPLRVRKSSKASSLGHSISESSGSAHGQESPVAESQKPRRVLTKTRPVASSPSKVHIVESPVMEGVSSQDALLFDSDPFAKVEGVQVVKAPLRQDPPSRTPSTEKAEEIALARDDSGSNHDGHDIKSEDHTVSEVPVLPKTPLTPVSPEDYKTARAQRRGLWLEKSLPPLVADAIAKQELDKEQEVGQEEEEERSPSPPPSPPPPPPPPTYFPIVMYLSDVNLFARLLEFLSFSEWSSLSSVNKDIRNLAEDKRLFREEVLERYLGTIGYVRWTHELAEPLTISLKDLNDYMRGVSMPTHQYARAAESYLQPGVVEQGEGANMLPFPDIEVLTASTRAYTRIVLRIRAQAEAEAKYLARMAAAEASPNHRSSPHVKKNGHWQSRASSRAPSPTSSMSHSHNHAHAHSPARGSRSRANTSSSAAKAFHSPLYQLHRAPLLRVFVPSPDGDWLSDTSVMECEAELKRAGVSKLLRVGDVVWDVAAGDEGNVGRMVWDGRYLIDLEYKYSKAGDLPRYFHSLAFSPSYFHRVIRTGPSASSSGGNPIVYMDVSPWGDELAANLQLLQDRMRTETPQGALHNVVRWVHRTSFELRRPVRPHHSDTRSNRSNNYRLPIPNVEGFFVDPGWYGTIVIEAEGTNEGLADLQERCGPGVFPPRPETVSGKSRGAKQEDTKRVFRIMREKSRPGEIWIRTVRDKERLM